MPEKPLHVTVGETAFVEACVRISELKRALALFANKDNWRRAETAGEGIAYTEWLGPDNGDLREPWEIAAAALESPPFLSLHAQSHE